MMTTTAPRSRTRTSRPPTQAPRIRPMSSACWDTSRARLASLQAAGRDQAGVIPPLATGKRFPAEVPAANHVTAGGKELPWRLCWRDRGKQTAPTGIIGVRGQTAGRENQSVFDCRQQRCVAAFPADQIKRGGEPAHKTNTPTLGRVCHQAARP